MKYHSKLHTLLFTLVLGAGLSCSTLKAQDSGEKKMVLSGFEKPIAAEWMKDTAGTGSPFEEESDPEKIKAGLSSARWEPAKRPWVFLKKCPQDWSGYQVLRFWLYAPEANGQKINFWFHSDNQNLDAQSAGKPRSYYFYHIKVDWTGWKQVTIDLSKCSPVRNPLGWNKISSFMISAKGGEATPLPGTLWWDEMELVGL